MYHFVDFIGIIISCYLNSVSYKGFVTLGLISALALRFVQFCYFYKSSVPRPTDGITDVYLQYLIVHIF
jgi:uncharacterized membrane protein YobD (UPF0266 family)